MCVQLKKFKKILFYPIFPSIFVGFCKHWHFNQDYGLCANKIQLKFWNSISKRVKWLKNGSTLVLRFLQKVATLPNFGHKNSATLPEYGYGNGAMFPYCVLGNRATLPNNVLGNWATLPNCVFGNRAMLPNRGRGNRAMLHIDTN